MSHGPPDPLWGIYSRTVAPLMSLPVAPPTLWIYFATGGAPHLHESPSTHEQLPPELRARLGLAQLAPGGAEIAAHRGELGGPGTPTRPAPRDPRGPGYDRVPITDHAPAAPRDTLAGMPMVARVLLSLVLSGSQETVQVPAPSAPVVDMASFDATMQVGLAQYASGEVLPAARTWVSAARMLPLTADQRGNFVAVHGNIADAYDRATRTDDPAVLREALAVLDELAVKYLTAYPGEPLAPRIEAVRERLRGRLVVLDAGTTRPAPILLVDRAAQPIIKPWRPLTYGGGAVVAGGVAMMAVFTVGLIRTKKYEDGLQTSAVQCQINTPDAPCGGEYDRYRMASTLQLTGMILGPAMLATGAAMMFVGLKRKRAAEQPKMIPMFSRGLYGLGVEGRF